MIDEIETLDSDLEACSFDTPELLKSYRRAEIINQTEVRCKPAA
jgi:hypothetical protein